MSRSLSLHSVDSFDLPLLLHIAAFADDGSPEWHPAFERIVGRITAWHIQESQEWRQWWNNAYVTTRLLRLCTTDKQRRATHAVIAVCRGMPYMAASHVYHLEIPRIASTERRMKRLVRRLYLPYEHKPY